MSSEGGSLGDARRLRRLDWGAWIKNQPYLRKWLILGLMIGIVAGLGAIAFSEALNASTRLFLGNAGYLPPLPFGEGNRAGSGGFIRPWAIPVVVAVGGLISGLLVERLAPEAAGHGTDAAIDAYHHDPTGVRPRVSVVKILASAVTIGSGGSGGREGPTAQISSSFASFLSRKLQLSPVDASIAMAVGIGSGIGAIFRAPLGGAVIGAEILFREDFESEALAPSLIASIVAFATFGAVEGFTPIFGYLKDYRFRHPVELFYYALLGVIAGLIGLLYKKSFYFVHHFTERHRKASVLRPAVGGLLVGCLALAVPAVLGTGYGWVQKAMSPPLLLAIPLWMVVALPFAKILSTSLSIGSGGSGGIFGPGMVIGGFAGAGLWRVIHAVAPGMPVSPAPLVVVGMVACFGSIAHAPLAVMLMVAEMTGTLEMLAPAMAAVGLATLVVGEESIYTSQLRSRADSPSHRIRFGLPVLEATSVRDAMSRPRLVFMQGLQDGQMQRELEAAGLAGAPVVDEEGRYVGAAGLNGPAGDALVIDRARPAVSTEATVEDAMRMLGELRPAWLPVVDDEMRVVGILSLSDLARAYRAALETGRRGLTGESRRIALLEVEVAEGSPAAGQAVRSIRWPPGVVVVAVTRRNQMIFPQERTVLEAGDFVTVFCPKDREEDVRTVVGRQ